MIELNSKKNNIADKIMMNIKHKAFDVTVGQVEYKPANQAWNQIFATNIENTKNQIYHYITRKTL